jgi:hypothetical protein
MKKLISLFLFIVVSSTVLKADEKPVVLYIGDSHSFGKLGIVLESYLSLHTRKVIMESSCGSTPNTWLGKSGNEKTVCGFWKKEGSEEFRSKEFKNPRLTDELARYRPDLTIVQLGTNIAAGARPLNAGAGIKEIMRSIKSEGSVCVWIGPPDANSKIVTKEKLKTTNDLLIKLSHENDCLYIDSLSLTQFPANNTEGIHYPPSLSKEWGIKITKILPQIVQMLKE